MNKDNILQKNMNIEEDVEEDGEEDVEEDAELSEEEIDDETRRLTTEAYNKYIIRLKNEEKEKEEELPKENMKSPVNKKPKKNNILSLTDFFTNVNVNENEKKSKLFVSKRVVDKKEKIPDFEELRRKFNPRLPPYNFVEHNRNVKGNKLNEEEFPTLGGK
jgi:hypothetical protein